MFIFIGIYMHLHWQRLNNVYRQNYVFATWHSRATSVTGRVPTYGTREGRQSQMKTATKIAASTPEVIRSVPNSCDAAKKTITNRHTWATMCRNQYLREGKKNEIFCACVLRDWGGEGERERERERDEKTVHFQHTKIVCDSESGRFTANGMPNR